MISFSFQMNLKSHFSIYEKSNMNLVIIVISIFIFHVNIHSVRGKKYQFLKFLKKNVESLQELIEFLPEFVEFLQGFDSMGRSYW